MADAKKCDICRKYYDQYQSVTLNNDTTLYGCRIRFATDSNVYYNSLDLCMECMTKVHTLLIDISEKAMERDRE